MMLTQLAGEVAVQEQAELEDTTETELEPAVAETFWLDCGDSV